MFANNQHHQLLRPLILSEASQPELYALWKPPNCSAAAEEIRNPAARRESFGLRKSGAETWEPQKTHGITVVSGRLILFLAFF